MTHRFVTIFGVLLLGNPAYAQHSNGTAPDARDPKGHYFQHKDWELACDNTGTCRAAGYPSDEAVSSDRMASVLLERAAGAGTPAIVRFKALDGPGGEEAKGKFSLRVGSAVAGSIDFDTDLPKAQASELLPKLLAGQSMELTQGKNRWTISLAGLGAMALKMDDLQRRVGTVGALAPSARGTKDETNVPKPVAKPTVQVAKLPSVDGTDMAIMDSLTKAVGKTGCTHKGAAIAIIKLNAAQVLYEIDPCDTAVYNGTSAYYLANIKAPHAPKRLEFDGPVNEFSGGVITGMHKGRGGADCISTASYAWDGKRFAKTAASGSGQCKGFLGGAWDLPTVVTQVINPNTKPAKSAKPAKK